MSKHVYETEIETVHTNFGPERAVFFLSLLAFRKYDTVDFSWCQALLTSVFLQRSLDLVFLNGGKLSLLVNQT